ncbi:MAG: hypothetical protein ACD_43C00226G0001 [uncultured bacterium]|nr:MAG: hypothetical protein ACD_43C00226G0001 [uncultured bacterium]
MEFAFGIIGICYVFSPLLVWGLVHWHWSRIGKDPVLLQKTIIPQYEPFQNLPPAVIGVVVDTKVNNFDVTATLLDLAVRGYLRIENHSAVTKHFGGKVHYYKTVDYRLILLKQDFSKDQVLFDYERELLRVVFANQLTEVSIQVAVQRIAQQLKPLRLTLYTTAVHLGLFTQPADIWRQRYFSVSRILFWIGFITSIVGIGIPFIFYGIIFRVYSRWMAQRTVLGMQAVQWSEGFKLFLHHAERYRAQRLTIEQAERILPYVVVLKLQIPAWQFELPHLPETENFFQATSDIRE